MFAVTTDGVKDKYSPIPGIVSPDAAKYIVVLDGIIQPPYKAYTVSTSPTGGEVFFFDETPAAGLELIVMAFRGSYSRTTTNFQGTGTKLVFSPVAGITSMDATKYIVTVGGLVQAPNVSYTVNALNGGSLVFDEAPALDAPVTIMTFY
jgi:hypothetical protein